MSEHIYSAAEVLSQASVIPVLVIEDLDDAVPLAQALVAGGATVLEVTLRSECALDAIKAIRASVPEAIVGAGTVTNTTELKAVIEAGSQFVISPGLTESLLVAAKNYDVPLIPGVATISELMLGCVHGLSVFKFFPAEASGGAAALKAFHGPFPNIRFCPTGGISMQNVSDYLALPNVLCVGGSWLAPKQHIENKNWKEITALAHESAILKTS